MDKKVADGLLRLILLKGPLGSCVFTGDYDQRALDETLRAFSKNWWVDLFAVAVTSMGPFFGKSNQLLHQNARLSKFVRT